MRCAWPSLRPRRVRFRPHVLDVVAKRSGGNPQFLRDLLRSAIDSGGTADLPESAEAATMTRIDTLAPDDRALVRRVAVFGLTFHPRMLPWLYSEEDGPAPDAAALSRLHELFDEEPDGYLRFRHTLLRDSAYEGLAVQTPATTSRRGRGAYRRGNGLPGGGRRPRCRCTTSKPANSDRRGATRRRPPSAREGVYAYVEAAGLYARALEAGRQIPDLDTQELAHTNEKLGDAWYLAREFQKASEAFTAARTLVASDELADASILLKLSQGGGKARQVCGGTALDRAGAAVSFEAAWR